MSKRELSVEKEEIPSETRKKTPETRKSIDRTCIERKSVERRMKDIDQRSSQSSVIKPSGPPTKPKPRSPTRPSTPPIL